MFSLPLDEDFFFSRRSSSSYSNKTQNENLIDLKTSQLVLNTQIDYIFVNKRGIY